MKSSFIVFLFATLFGSIVRAEITAGQLVKGGVYMNGPAQCEVMGVGGAGVRIKYLSGAVEGLSTEKALKVLSIPGRGGCQASLADTRKQLAMIDAETSTYEASGTSYRDTKSAPATDGGNVSM